MEYEKPIFHEGQKLLKNGCDVISPNINAGIKTMGGKITLD